MDDFTFRRFNEQDALSRTTDSKFKSPPRKKKAPSSPKPTTSYSSSYSSPRADKQLNMTYQSEIHYRIRSNDNNENLQHLRFNIHSEIAQLLTEVHLLRRKYQELEEKSKEQDTLFPSKQIFIHNRVNSSDELSYIQENYTNISVNQMKTNLLKDIESLNAIYEECKEITQQIDQTGRKKDIFMSSDIYKNVSDQRQKIQLLDFKIEQEESINQNLQEEINALETGLAKNKIPNSSNDTLVDVYQLENELIEKQMIFEKTKEKYSQIMEEAHEIEYAAATSLAQKNNAKKIRLSFGKYSNDDSFSSYFSHMSSNIDDFNDLNYDFYDDDKNKYKKKHKIQDLKIDTDIDPIRRKPETPSPRPRQPNHHRSNSDSRKYFFDPLNSTVNANSLYAVTISPYSRCISVGLFAKMIQKQDIINLFSQFGEVEDIEVFTKSHVYPTQYYVNIRFDTHENAQKAIEKANHKKYKDTVLSVKWATNQNWTSALNPFDLVQPLAQTNNMTLSSSLNSLTSKQMPKPPKGSPSRSIQRSSKSNKSQSSQSSTFEDDFEDDDESNDKNQISNKNNEPSVSKSDSNQKIGLSLSSTQILETAIKGSVSRFLSGTELTFSSEFFNVNKDFSKSRTISYSPKKHLVTSAPLNVEIAYQSSLNRVDQHQKDNTDDAKYLNQFTEYTDVKRIENLKSKRHQLPVLKLTPNQSFDESPIEKNKVVSSKDSYVSDTINEYLSTSSSDQFNNVLSTTSEKESKNKLEENESSDTNDNKTEKQNKGKDIKITASNFFSSDSSFNNAFKSDKQSESDSSNEKDSKIATSDVLSTQSDKNDKNKKSKSKNQQNSITTTDNDTKVTTTSNFFSTDFVTTDKINKDKKENRQNSEKFKETTTGNFFSTSSGLTEKIKNNKSPNQQNSAKSKDDTSFSIDSILNSKSSEKNDTEAKKENKKKISPKLPEESSELSPRPRMLGYMHSPRSSKEKEDEKKDKDKDILLSPRSKLNSNAGKRNKELENSINNELNTKTEKDEKKAKTKKEPIKKETQNDFTSSASTTINKMNNESDTISFQSSSANHPTEKVQNKALVNTISEEKILMIKKMKLKQEKEKQKREEEKKKKEEKEERKRKEEDEKRKKEEEEKKKKDEEERKRKEEEKKQKNEKDDSNSFDSSSSNRSNEEKKIVINHSKKLDQTFGFSVSNSSGELSENLQNENSQDEKEKSSSSSSSFDQEDKKVDSKSETTSQIQEDKDKKSSSTTIGIESVFSSSEEKDKKKKKKPETTESLKSSSSKASSDTCSEEESIITKKKQEERLRQNEQEKTKQKVQDKPKSKSKNKQPINKDTSTSNIDIMSIFSSLDEKKKEADKTGSIELGSSNNSNETETDKSKNQKDKKSSNSSFEILSFESGSDDKKSRNNKESNSSINITTTDSISNKEDIKRKGKGIFTSNDFDSDSKEGKSSNFKSFKTSEKSESDNDSSSDKKYSKVKNKKEKKVTFVVDDYDNEEENVKESNDNTDNSKIEFPQITHQVNTGLLPKLRFNLFSKTQQPASPVKNQKDDIPNPFTSSSTEKVKDSKQNKKEEVHFDSSSSEKVQRNPRQRKKVEDSLVSSSSEKVKNISQKKSNEIHFDSSSSAQDKSSKLTKKDDDPFETSDSDTVKNVKQKKSNNKKISSSSIDIIADTPSSFSNDDPDKKSDQKIDNSETKKAFSTSDEIDIVDIFSSSG